MNKNFNGFPTTTEEYEYYFKYIEKIHNNNYQYQIDKDEFMSLGNIALTKAVNKFDASRGIAFKTYLIELIKSEVYMELRKIKAIKRASNVVSLDEKQELKEGEGDNRYNMIVDEKNNIDNIINNKLLINTIYKFIKKANYKQKMVIQNCLLSDKGQIGLAKELNISQSYISKIRKEAIKDLQKELKKVGITN